MGIAEHSEVERKLDVDDGVVVPDLVGVPGVVEAVARADVLLVAEYLDTPDLALLRAGITLRRRTGGDDAGWHLKLPRSTTERNELRLPLAVPARGAPTTAEEVPEGLLDRVRGIVRDRPVARVAVIETRRSVRAVLGAPSTVLAEVCDDRVTARPAGGGVRTWREWEVELVDGVPDDLEALCGRLETAGARPAEHRSKLERALGREVRPRGRGPAGEQRQAYHVARRLLRAQIDELVAADLRIRSGELEAIHDARIAARRLRSTLSTYAGVLGVAAHPSPTAAPTAVPHLVGDPSAPVGDLSALLGELRALGAALGEARDAQVMLVRLQARVADQPPELVVGPVPARLTAELDAAVRTGVEHALATLGSARYFRLLDALELLAGDDPAVSSTSRASARKVARRSLRTDVRRVEHAMRAVEATTGLGNTLDAALHDVRKKAKRVRYAAEAAADLLGPRSERLAEAARALQVVLGEHQDSVVARRLLVDLARQAALEGENGFTYGRLHAREEAAALRVERGFARTRREWRREVRRFSR